MRVAVDVHQVVHAFLVGYIFGNATLLVINPDEAVFTVFAAAQNIVHMHVAVEEPGAMPAAHLRRKRTQQVLASVG